MKKRTIYLLIIFGLLLFIPFHFFINASGYYVPENGLRMLGIASMIGAIFILIGLLNFSSVVEFKIVVRKKTVNGS